MSRGFAATLAMVLGVGCGAAAAQSYPVKPVRLVVAFSPGGAADIIGRIVARGLTEQLGEQVLVDNRAGVGGTLAAGMVAKAPPDGYTLLMYTSAHTISPSLRKLTYDPVRDFAPIAKMASGVSALVVHPSVPAKTTRELVALAKKHPGKLDFASGGVGSFTHLSIALFEILGGVDIAIIEYRSAGPAVVGVVAGESQASISTLSAFMPHIKSGRLRLLGIGTAKRSAALPDVPTIAEGGVRGFVASPWFGLAAPAGTPQAVIDRLNSAVAATLAAPEVRQALIAQGADPDHVGPAEFVPFIKAELVKWADVVRKANIPMQ